MYPQQLDGRNVLQHLLVRFLPIIQKRKLTSQLRIQNSPMAGYPSEEFDTASTPSVQIQFPGRHSPIKTLSAGVACTPAKFRRTSTVHNVYSSTKSKINGSCRDRAEHSLFHRAILRAKATRLYASAGTLLALDRPILSQPLITILRGNSTCTRPPHPITTTHHYTRPSKYKSRRLDLTC
jgi:hypothetical protein